MSEEIIRFHNSDRHDVDFCPCEDCEDDRQKRAAIPRLTPEEWKRLIEKSKIPPDWWEWDEESPFA